MTAVYYKSLFAISAIISLICDFRWSVNGVLIGTLTAFGLLFGFGEGRLWLAVMWINIVHIFFNYFAMFLAYPAVVQMLGVNAAEQIKKYAYMLGSFEITSGGLHSLFLESIIIFIVSVECAELYHKLSETSNAPVSEAHVLPMNDPVADVASVV